MKDPGNEVVILSNARGIPARGGGGGLVHDLGIDCYINGTVILSLLI